MKAPAYFERIRERAVKRWEQLECDPELAGPWHQLFKQVQSPRHVLSELLQNADDAGATDASVEIQNGEFRFAHNGEDFTEEHFTSLCRFGYSNKRSLHTIGFRGIGFKSTFSLGDRVQLSTPTLSIAFHRERFTAPIWMERTSAPPDRTEVQVAIKDHHRQRELEKNLQEWLTSPASLLFFRHIRRLRIGERDLRWLDLGAGPVSDSAWMALHDSHERKYLLLRSSPAAFPEEALNEIRNERMLAADEESDFPPCQIEILLGIEGRLFVVLPTGVKTALPFGCNAPFVQDPARVKIKDPEISPTNRWLLKRAGELAAQGMLSWLEQSDLDPKERAQAYNLFPDVDREDSSLEGSCATIVEEALADALDDKRYVLAESGELEGVEGCVAFPEPMLDTWSAEQLSALFDSQKRPVLCRHIAPEDREKLIHWGIVDSQNKDQILWTLRVCHPPKPKSWRQLLTLWSYVSGEIVSYLYRQKNTDIRIVPVQGKDVLYAAGEVVRLGEKKLLQSQDDWEFLSQYLLVLNQNWPRFLAEQRREAEESEDQSLGRQVEEAYSTLERLGLDETSDASTVIAQVAESFFNQEEIALRDCVRLAQLAAALGASAGSEFKYVTRDGRIRSTQHNVVFDPNGEIEALVEEGWADEHLLHPDYHHSPQSCTKAEWQQWAGSDRSGLSSFIPLNPRSHEFWGKSKLTQLLLERGHSRDSWLPYVTNKFVIEDWDFEEAHWRHWRRSAAEDARYWGELMTRILSQPPTFWSRATSARVLQVATTGTKKAITQDPILPAWIVKFRALPCLQDTRGFYRQPAELLRRTPETESLLDVEPFVHAKLDTEANRPLLIALGVRDTPTGPDRLLESLRALAKAERPPVHEVEKWYRRLDRMIVACSTEDFDKVRQAFANERIILSENGGWIRASEVFLRADEADAPGAALVHPSVHDLMLWTRVGVADRPTADLAIAWLKSLPSGKSLSADEVRRISSLLKRHPERIWNECAHWLNLEGEWAPTSSFSYTLSMQSLVPRTHLFVSAKRKTADFLQLPVDVTERPPFSELPTLSSRIEDRIENQDQIVGAGVEKAWLSQLGNELRRVVLENETETARVRELASRLATTVWRQTVGLETVPYIDGVPAGTPRRVEALWKGTTLYVDDRPTAKLARPVAHELGRFFRADVADAIKMCFDRSPQFISEYLEENFKLAPWAEIAVPEPVPVRQAEKEALPRSGVQEDGAPDVESRPSEHDHPGGELKEEEAEEVLVLDTEEQRENEREPGPPRQPRASKPSLIARFARSLGYAQDRPDRFFHPDGSWIERSDGAFPWERRSASGDLVQYYFPKDHCLMEEPLQLEADVWAMLEKYPDSYSLILVQPDESPVAITGRKLREMRMAGELALHPATYRLVYREE